MTRRVLVIGGYGHFGRFVSRMLAREPDIQVVIAGRDRVRAEALAREIEAPNPPEAAQLDIHADLPGALKRLRPDVVVHTSGPYQGQDYTVARACIEQGCHYIDLADARDFVANIGILDNAAKANGVLVCGGASSVPALTGAVIDRYIDEFQTLESVDYGITTAQLSNRGLATTAAVLSYAGKPFNTLIDGEIKPVYGWLGLRFRTFRRLGRRALGYCDVPDLAIFPLRYPSLKTIRFQAGLELKLMHLALAGLSWLVRLKIIPSLRPLAPFLLRLSRLFDVFGTDNSGFFMELSGSGLDGYQKRILFEITASHGDGVRIPTIAAVLMAKKLVAGEVADRGAMPCVGLIELGDFLGMFKEFHIDWQDDR